MTTTHYKDISGYQSGIAIDGPVVCIKATEGAGYLNKDFGPAVVRAHNSGTWPFAYHFLHAGNTYEQAEFCHDYVGTMPLMLDWELTAGSRPGVSDAISFIDRYRALGGITHVLYLPHWYWQEIGSPSLSPFIRRNMFLVSSNYTYYTESPSGAGWQPYGGMTPKVWQHTASESWHGFLVDCNAFRGTAGELRNLISGSAVSPPRPPGKAPSFPYPAGHYLGQPSPSPYCHSGYYGGIDNTNVHTWQAKMAGRGWTISADGRFGPESERVARSFQAEKGLDIDGKVGTSTWAATWTAPVT